MRTTLKRGIGRSLGPDGNGYSSLPPAFGPVTRYWQPEPPRRSIGRVLLRGLGWFVLALLVVASGLAGGLYLWLHQSLVAVSAHTPAMKRAQKQLHAVLPGHATIALVLGDNQRRGREASAGGRSDTILLVRADPRTKTISLLSLPRDLRVPVWCPPHRSFGVTRIDYAFSYCGPAGSLETVEKLTGLRVNYLVTVGFHGFKEIVNDVGGVWLDIDRRYYIPPHTGVSAINLQPGYQLLSGGGALEFVRYRHTDSDFYRQARQQEFLRALKDQLSQHLDPLQVPKIVGAIVHNVEVGACRSCLGDATVFGYALFALTLPRGHLLQNYVGGTTNVFVGGADELQAPPGAVARAVSSFTHPHVPAVAGSRKAHTAPGAPPAHEVTLTVLNGNGEAGAAALATSLLRQRGYRTLAPPGGVLANAPTATYPVTRIYADTRLAQAAAAAVALRRLLAPATIVPLTTATKALRALDPGSMLLVVLGHSFHNALAGNARSRGDVKQQATPPAVRYDPSASRALLAPLVRRAGFPLELPTVLESSSVPDTLPSDTPVRLYTITRGQKAVRLIYHTAGDQFWGIEETAWTGAPILSSPSEYRTIDHRRFALYFHDAKLHMVVLQTSKGSYWVINTLLDSLSNQTMLAIARGLHPLTGARHR
jgi:LCP family protein required for cell wall assembly